jgi:hypothetical protein
MIQDQQAPERSPARPARHADTRTRGFRSTLLAQFAGVGSLFAGFRLADRLEEPARALALITTTRTVGDGRDDPRSQTGWLDQLATRRFLAWSTAVWLLIHALMWTVESFLLRKGPLTILRGLDSLEYSTIATAGYAGPRYAFYPLFP